MYFSHTEGCMNSIDIFLDLMECIINYSAVLRSISIQMNLTFQLMLNGVNGEGSLDEDVLYFLVINGFMNSYDDFPGHSKENVGYTGWKDIH